MHVAINEFTPSATLRPYVQSYWLGDFNMHVHNGLSQAIVPNGHIELIIHLTDNHCNLYKDKVWAQSPDFTIIGMFAEPYTVMFDSHVHAFGIRLTPEGFYHIFGTPSAEVYSTFGDLEVITGNSFNFFCEEVRLARSVQERIDITERYFSMRLSDSYLQDDYVALTANLIRSSKGNVNIAGLHEQVPISARQLQRKFKEMTGMTPKAYIRIARMNAVHAYLNTQTQVALTDLAYENGFADQSHFVREFRQLTGVNPRNYLREKEKYIVNAG